MSNLIGQSLGRYHILEQLGEGGMATVYKAYDTRLETEVAVKVIRTDSILPRALERAVKRFDREAKALAKLTHANIVKVLDYGEFEGSPFIVMPYLPGGTLKELLKGKPMPWQEAAHLLIPIARALDFAHRRGMIHRDVKPSNIIITADGDPMLTDFGIAKFLDIEETVELTGTNASVGTPDYMAPEQSTSKSTDYRADIYSLGVVFYEMVTGRKPYIAETPMAVLIKHASEPLPRPSQFVPDLPNKVEHVLIKTLAKQPGERYQTMRELLNALEQLLSDLNNSQFPLMGKPSLASNFIKPSINTSQKTKFDLQIQRLNFQKFRFWVVGILALALVAVTAWVIMTERGAAIQVQPTNTENLKEIPALIFTSAPSLPTITVEIPISFTSTPQPSITPTSLPTNTTAISPTATMLVLERKQDGMKLVYIPEGNFMMGNDAGAEDEKPVHEVYTNSFWMDQTEVTTEMFVAFMNANRSKVSYTRPFLYYGNRWIVDLSCSGCGNFVDRIIWNGDSDISILKGTESYPVTMVTWHGARNYCVWVGGRLPTEAEWERAARGTNSLLFPWGNEYSCKIGNFYNEPSSSESCDTFSGAAPVGSFPNGASQFGVLDLAGNAYEWVSSQYAGYPYNPLDGRENFTDSVPHVFRGASWWYWGQDDFTMASRWKGDGAYMQVGFRCVMDKQP